MLEYHVVWRIKVCAPNSVEAASEAQFIMQNLVDTNWAFEVAELSDYRAHGDLADFVMVDLHGHLTAS